MNRRSQFSQADVTRAVRGVVAAGQDVQSVEVRPDGGIIVHCAPSASQVVRINPLDRLLVSKTF